jgi:cytochrome c oxidase cbb3-type subunit 3
VLGVACNQTPPDLRPWQPSDHDHTTNPNADQVQVNEGGADPDTPPGLDDVTIVTWQQNCTVCHGQLGRGDGPQGPMLHVSNLSNPSWQATVTDEAIGITIRSGRGRMPAFNFPDPTLRSLVRLIRLLDASRMNGAASAASGQPAASAAPLAHPSSAPAHAAAPAAALGPKPNAR